MLQIPGLYIAEVEDKGRAVFTALDIPKGSSIEICQVIVVPPEQVVQIHKTVLHDYYFRWGADQTEAAILLGNGSIYNHSSNPNAHVILDFGEQVVVIEALVDIVAGEEICFDYFDGGSREDLMWFEER